MPTSPRASLLVACLTLCFLNTSIYSAEPAASDPTRQAIERGLPFVEREGTEWMNKRKCMSCHQVSTMVWTFNEAQQRGFTVDAEKLKLWNDWCFKNSLGGKPYFRLGKLEGEEFKDAALSEQETKLLGGIATQDFTTERAFLSAVESQLEPTDKDKDIAAILKASTKPGVSPGAQDGPSPAYQILLHTGTPAATAKPDEAVAALLEGLRRTQQPDGLWKTSGQFLGMNRPKSESTEVNTMWILVALSRIEPLPPELVECRKKAEHAIAKALPGVSTESLLLHALWADVQNDSAKRDTLLKELLSQQRADGGWAWRKENTDSDALTTGEILYGLGRLGKNVNDPAAQKARDFLLAKQLEDGSWNAPWLLFNVENKKDHTDGNKVFSYWATTWSLLGLMETMVK